MAERPAADHGAPAPAGSEGWGLADSGHHDPARGEQWRLDTLREYGIMDTDAEPAFDRVTKLVAGLFDVPIALISLVDDCRLWFKSAHGLDIPEVDRDASFCRHVVTDDRPLVVPDVVGDPRFQDNPFVTGEPFVRFYAGVPLRAYNGAILGALCIVDRKPRTAPDAHEMERLEDFAAIVMAEAELRRIIAERDEARRTLERALDFSGIATWRYDSRSDNVRWRGAVAELWGADYRVALATRDDTLARIHADD
ncbi:MAG: histidine kinase, partial [Sphingopyxis sp.]|nr:histidine kinase [Sphingopyxis sp.]